MVKKHKVIVFDLDDTLYKEIDFLESAYTEIADYFRDQFGIYGLRGEMLRYYHEGKDVFQEIIDFYKRPVTKEFLLNMYRYHKPNIKLDVETKNVLDALNANPDYSLGIITDGRFTSQMNKIEALGLNKYFSEDDNIIISEVFNHGKPDVFSYSLMECLLSGDEYVYVGDNPEKDFKGANERGWTTICLKDNGRNIHKQDSSLSAEYLPQCCINSITELLNLI